MKKFVKMTGVAAPILRANVDTDALLPGRFLTKAEEIGKSGFGAYLFADWRRGPDGGEDPDFVLNQPLYRKATILLGGDNFGCGSSREHAVWALAGFGIRCVMAPGFGEIFFNNCFKNFVLPIVLEPQIVDGLAAQVSRDGGGGELTVDLEACTVSGPDGAPHAFTIDASRRAALLEGLDDIGVTLRREDEIAAFQAADRARRPWIYL